MLEGKREKEMKGFRQWGEKEIHSDFFFANRNERSNNRAMEVCVHAGRQNTIPYCKIKMKTLFPSECTKKTQTQQ